MNSIFIIVLIGIIFLERNNEYLSELFQKIRNNPAGLFKYLGAASIFAATLSSLPLFLLTIYMREKGFFAYEIFSFGDSSISFLSANIFANYLLLTFGLFVSGILYAAKADKISLGITIIINLIFLGYFILLGVVSSNWILVLSIFTFCAVIAVYLFFWLSGSIEDKAKYWWFPIALSFLIVFLPVVFYQAASKFTEASLSQMKVGGINVKLFEANSITSKEKKYLEGRLFLRTKENIYFQEKGTDKILIASNNAVGIEYTLSNR